MKVVAFHDSPELYALIQQCASALGHNVMHLNTEQAICSHFVDDSADMLVLDADLPAVNCFESIEQIRQLQKDWLPVIVLTSMAAEVCNKGIFEGGDAYLMKPLYAPLLRAQICALERNRRMQLQSLTAHRELQLLLDATVDGILTTDAEGRIQTANRAVEKIFGYSLEEIEGVNVSLLNADHNVVKGQSGVEGRYYETLGVRKNGERFPIEIDVSHYRVGSTFYYLSVMRDITERKEAEKQIQATQKALLRSNKKLEKLSFFDPLTGLANRRNFQATLLREFKLARREKSLLSLILCDIDFFKLYNDHYGHQGGDDCLQQVADIIGAVAKRPADLACRYGGEEFAVILPKTDIPGAAYIAEAIRAKVQNSRIPHAASKIADCVTLSLGCVTNAGQAEDIEALIKAADDALYAAKEQGRNRFVRA